LKVSQQQITPLYDYELLAEVSPTPFTFGEFHLGIRYAYNEKFVRLFGQRLNNQSNFPIVELQYIKGLDDFWNGEWAYDKFLFSVNHTFRRKALGKTKYRLEAGYINKVVPYSKLFTSFGLGAGYRGFGLGITQGFQTMKINEFLSDRFVHLFFKQDFGTLLLKSKKFKPNIVLEHNLAFGSLQRSEIHQNLEFKTLEKGFFEAGLVLENLIKVKYFNMYYIGLGAGMYYRYGPYQNELFKDNVAWGLKISISY